MDLPSIRRKLHQLAETAGEEQKTAAYVEKVLEDIGIHAIERGLGGTGLIGWLDSGNPGPVVLFRAELDALPIEEKNSLEYASQTNGVAHKCGHDGHMAVLLGFANRVARQTLKKGKAGFLFQPAEETGEGAARMLEDKTFPSLKPDHIFAFHNLPGYPKGHILTTNGVFCAGSKGLIVRLSGSTSHAAHPEKARSPSTALATLIHTLEQLPRSVAPFDHAALVTIIHAQLGEKAFGTTPGHAELNATLRAHDPDVLKALGDKAVAMAQAIAKTWGLEVETEWTEVFEPAVNHPDSFSVLEQAWNSLEQSGDTRGLSKFIKMEKPFSWSEDFGRFTHVFPGAMFGLGAGEDTPPLHDEYYDFPDDLIEPAVAYFGAIMDVIQNKTLD